MFILYDLIFLIVAIIYLPVYLFRRKFHRGFLSRLGFLPDELELNRPICIHAVSVGEAMAIKGLLEELRIIYPHKRFVISTVTPTGNKIANTLAQEKDFVTYLPLDFSFIVRRVIDRIDPWLFIIAETELWPNLISYLYKKKVPIVVVNARISDKSLRGYQSIKILAQSLFNKINLFCVQTELDSQRLISLGAAKDKIRITGNMKFDIADYKDLKTDYADLRIKLGLQVQEKLLVCGSTHPGEEEIILTTYKNLLNEFSNLRLLIAPRRPERSNEAASLIKNFGFKPLRISLLNTQTLKYSNIQTVFILDTVGQLPDFYALATIVFVGGSLIKKGGHNILEPASLGKPILFGPHMFNFRDIRELFLIHKAAILVRNQRELEINIRYLLNDPSEASRLAQRAKDLILQNQGATKRNIGLIKECLR